MCCLKIERTHDITTYFGVIFVSGHYNIVLSIDNELFLVPAIPLQVIPTWWVLFLVLAGNHHAVWGDAISILGWATQPDCWSNPFFLKTSLQRCATGWACQSTHTSTELNLLTSNFTLLACIHANATEGVNFMNNTLIFFAAKSTSSSQLKQNCPDQMNNSRNALFLLITILNLLLSEVAISV